MRLFLFDQAAQCLCISHIDDVGAVSNLVTGRVHIAVDGNHLGAQALQGDDDFLTQFARTQQHDTGSGRT